MVRKCMGIMAGEQIDCTTDQDENGSYSEFLIPAPSLVFESSRNFPIKWYFGAHVIISKEEYFLVIGDQIENTVFICAVHEVGKHLPTGFICLDADAFHNWLNPTEGNTTIEPPHQAWGFYDAIQFCGNTMKPGDSNTSSYYFKACIDTKEAFENIVLTIITHVIAVKEMPEYSFLFLNPSNHSESSQPDGETTTPSSPKLSRAQKAAKTREENKKKDKEKFVPKRGQVVAGYNNVINPPIVDVNKIRDNAQTQANKAKPKGSGGSKKTTVTKKGPTKRGPRQRNVQQASGKSEDEGSDSYEDLDHGVLSNQLDLPPYKKSSKTKSELPLPFGNTLLGSLTKATEALVNAIKVKNESNEVALNPEGKSMRTLLREEAEADHKLDHLKFMDKMVEAQAALNLKAGNPLPVVAMAQHQSTTTVTATPPVASNYENQSMSHQAVHQIQNQQLLVKAPNGQLTAPMMIQLSPLHQQGGPQTLNGQSPYYQQQQYQPQQGLENSHLQMQYQQTWQSPEFLQQMQYQYQNASSPAAQYDSNMWASHQHQYNGMHTPQQFAGGMNANSYANSYDTFSGNGLRDTRSTYPAHSKQGDSRYTMYQQTMPGAKLLENYDYLPSQRGVPSRGSQQFQRQQMGFQQPNSWRGNQYHDVESTSSAPNQNSYSGSKR
jgi:hypothetical protein